MQNEILFFYTVLRNGREVMSLIQNLWVPANRKITLCIDSYESGVMKGRFFHPEYAAEHFESLTQFLVKLDALLDEIQQPQSYTVARTFAPLPPPETSAPFSRSISKGNLCTFELQILFRQHTSWQGVLLWQNRKLEQRFRSVLELVLLLDSALREEEGKEAV